MAPKRKTGPPKHQNAFAWVPNSGDKHNSLQKALDKLDLRGGVCHKCFEVIDWKKKYGKYKPRKQPGKCLGCNEKTVCQAYHQLCPRCTSTQGVCAKCMQAPPAPRPPEEIANNEAAKMQMELESKMHTLSERQRRSAQRMLDSQLGHMAAKKDAIIDAESSSAGEERAMATGEVSPTSGCGSDGVTRESTESMDELLAKAMDLGLLSEADMDRATDSIALGSRSEADVIREWAPRVRAAMDETPSG